MHFANREEGGRKVAEQLKKHENKPNTIVIGLPRGGVVTAAEITKALNLPLDIIVTRKIGTPHQPELAIGAITYTGELILHESTIQMLGLSLEEIEPIIKKEKKEAERRMSLYRSGLPPINLTGKTVILTDDGIATGSTVKAAIKTIRSLGVKKLILAIPVAPSNTIHELTPLVDELICLSTPPFFVSVGQFYDQFSQTEDEQVIEIMKQFALPSLK